MATNLTDIFRNTYGDMLIRECSGLLGESAQSISAAIDSIVPSLLSAMITKSNTDQGMRDLLDFIKTNDLKEVSFRTETTDDLMTKGSGLLNYLFGSHLVLLNDTISSQGGLKTSSASALLKIIAPLFVGFFARTIEEKSLSTGNAKDLLHAQIDFIKQDIPKALSDVQALPIETTSAGAKISEQDMKYIPPTGMSKILPWIVLLLASLGLFYLLEKGCNAPLPSDKITPTESRDTI